MTSIECIIDLYDRRLDQPSLKLVPDGQGGSTVPASTPAGRVGTGHLISARNGGGAWNYGQTVLRATKTIHLKMTCAPSGYLRFVIVGHGAAVTFVALARTVSALVPFRAARNSCTEGHSHGQGQGVASTCAPTLAKKNCWFDVDVSVAVALNRRVPGSRFVPTLGVTALALLSAGRIRSRTQLEVGRCGTRVHSPAFHRKTQTDLTSFLYNIKGKSPIKGRMKNPILIQTSGRHTA